MRAGDVLGAAFEAEDALGRVGRGELHGVRTLERRELQDRARLSEPAEELPDPPVAGVVDLAAEGYAVDLEARAPGCERGEATRERFGVRCRCQVGPQVTAKRARASSSSSAPVKR